MSKSNIKGLVDVHAVGWGGPKEQSGFVRSPQQVVTIDDAFATAVDHVNLVYDTALKAGGTLAYILPIFTLYNEDPMKNELEKELKGQNGRRR